ncbi:cell differentiation protein rcd1 [Gossypium hirsutum]|uniref:Cell differentiation protein rcd1 n=1 Tax=Gossypium hirsutum TaxID=3635 RepID=A0ABM3AD63_GOSHI|nr:cell differentiation protein rcd1-like [Gossypium hirsutum]
MVSGAVAPITSNPPVRVRYLIRGVASKETQEQSLDVLCKNGLAYDNLAVLLWNSFGTMSVLLKIITSAYGPLLSDGLTERAVTQVCNAIALFQVHSSTFIFFHFSFYMLRISKVSLPSF